MPFGDYIAGLAFFAVTWGGVLGAAALVTWRRLPELRGAPRILALGMLATAGIVAVHLLPGLVGLLSRWTAAALALALLAAATRLSAVREVGGSAADGAFPSPAGRPDPAPEPMAESGPVSWAIAALAAGGTALWFLANLVDGVTQPPLDIDTLAFHLPNVAKWIQTGTFWRVDQFVPLLSSGNYPQNGDVVFLSTVLPWENDAFVKPLNIPYVALAGVAVYAAAAELRAPRSTSVLAAALFCSVPIVVLSAEDGGKTDMILLATLGAGVVFLLRHFRTGRRSDLLLAGLALGLAFGTKWYAVSSVPVVLAVWAGASLAARRDWRPVAKAGALLGGLVAVAGGFWLMRNLVESGNPAPPLDVPPFWDAPTDYVRECGGFTIVDYLGDWDVLDRWILPAWWDNWSLPGFVLLGGIVAGGALGFAARRPGGGRALALAVCALLLAGLYTITPYSAFGPEGAPFLTGANSRYLFPALIVAAPLLAWAIGRLGKLRLAGELLALIATAQGVRAGFDLPRSAVAEVALVLLVAGGMVVGLARLGRRPWRSRGVQVAAALAAVAIVVGAGHALQRKFNDDRYRGLEPTLDWIADNAPEHARIGLSGLWDVNGLSPILPSFGPRLRNEVEYVGVTVDGQMREPDTRDEWLARIRDGGYEYLLVGSGGYSPTCPVPGGETDERAWADAQGWEKVAESARLALYRLAPADRAANMRPST